MELAATDLLSRRSDERPDSTRVAETIVPSAGDVVSLSCPKHSNCNTAGFQNQINLTLTMVDKPQLSYDL